MNWLTSFLIKRFFVGLPLDKKLRTHSQLSQLTVGKENLSVLKPQEPSVFLFFYQVSYYSAKFALPPTPDLSLADISVYILDPHTPGVLTKDSSSLWRPTLCLAHGHIENICQICFENVLFRI